MDNNTNCSKAFAKDLLSILNWPNCALCELMEIQNKKIKLYQQKVCQQNCWYWMDMQEWNLYMRKVLLKYFKTCMLEQCEIYYTATTLKVNNITN